MTRMTERMLAVGILLALATSAHGQASSVAALVSDGAPAPRTYALIAAFGEHMTFVQGRAETGSNIEAYRRKGLVVPDNGLNKVILRALDTAVAQQAPHSRRIHLAIDPKVVDSPHPNERESAAVEAAMEVVRRLPQREQWDEIFVVTPAYVLGPSDGLAPRLHGAGVYVHPVTSAELTISQHQSNSQPRYAGFAQLLASLAWKVSYIHRACSSHCTTTHGCAASMRRRWSCCTPRVDSNR